MIQISGFFEIICNGGWNLGKRIATASGFFSPLDSLNNVKIKTLLKNHAKIAAFPFSGLKFENLQFGWITIWNEFVETLIL